MCYAKGQPADVQTDKAVNYTCISLIQGTDPQNSDAVFRYNLTALLADYTYNISVSVAAVFTTLLFLYKGHLHEGGKL